MYQEPNILLENIDSYDAIMTDFEMGTMTAFELLDKMRTVKIPKIIISSHPEYVYQSFAYKVFWYIQKSQLSNHFLLMMEELLATLDENNHMISLEAMGVSIHIPKAEIRYIEKQKNYLYIHGNQTYKIRYSFKKVIDQFYDECFVIPVYGTMVNIQYIRYVHSGKKYLVMHDGILLPLSYTHRNKVIQQINDYKIKRPNG